MTYNAVKENLSAYAHAAWVGWMEYLFAKSQHNGDGSVTIPIDLVERWTRQMNTPYSELPDNEKASDRKEADQMLDIVTADAVVDFRK